MSAPDILDALLRVNLAAGAAILGVAVLRKTARTWFGARLAYGLWLLPLLAGAAMLVPARQVVVVRSAAPALDRVHQVIATGASSATTVHLDTSMLLLGLWLAGMAVAALVMAVLQGRFVSRARAGGVGPAVVGVIAPRIVTPTDFAERYSSEEQALILAHERAHLTHQDSRLNGLCALVQCLCWFNPLVHLAARLMRIDQELACDEVVVGRFPAARRAYAELLMKAQLTVLPLPLGCYWPSKSPHPLLERVAMLKHDRVSRLRQLAGAGALAILCASAGLTAWAAQPAQVRMVSRPDGAPPADAILLAQADSPASRDTGAQIIQRIVVQGAERVDRRTVLSYLGVRPGQAFSSETSTAAGKRLLGTGLFSGATFRMQGGDLIVRVTEKPVVGAAFMPISTRSGPTSATADESLAAAQAAEEAHPPIKWPETAGPKAEGPALYAQQSALPPPGPGAKASNFELKWIPNPNGAQPAAPPPVAATGDWKVGWIAAPGSNGAPPAPDPAKLAQLQSWSAKVLGNKAVAGPGPIAIEADHVSTDAKTGITRYEGDVEMTGNVRDLDGVRMSGGGGDGLSRPLDPGKVAPDSTERFLFAADSLEIKSDESTGKIESISAVGQIMFWKGGAAKAQ